MISKEEARENLKKLIIKYHEYKKDKKLMGNERQICDSLIRPFFRDVLGWNIDDPYEFKSEYPQGGKRIDYLVCIEGISQFIIEAKAPSKEINDKTGFYKQTVQYAESKGKDFAILTNFKTFIIFRAGIQTSGIFANEIRKIDILNLTEEGFDFLWYFSKGFWIEKGEENPLYSHKNLKKKRPLDEILVEDMSKWREYLLRNLREKSESKYNFKNKRELSYIEEEVQKFVNRLIFICYCEDKQISDNELKPLLNEYGNKRYEKKTFIIKKIKDLFENYNQTYNSDLFKKSLCDQFEFDDGILSEILEDLRGYYGGLPYDFSVIDADILGSAYENFLGHVITEKVGFKEEKDIGKRKKMGIYYTPQYIVNYIIKNTVREYTKNKSFDEILKIKILDPACGSGSFLIKVFDVLVEESKVKLKRELTYEEKKKLMLNCIHGVDLDEGACDIAKLNLSLKLVERGKKLPFFHNNIKNGNSLIDNEKVDPLYFFKWEKEFPFKFDIIIGNPPYVKEDINREVFEAVKKTDMRKYYQGKMDLWYFFTCKALDLLKEGGLHSYIAQNNWITNAGASILRNKILSDSKIISFFDFNEFKVFKEAGIQTMVFVLEKKKINRPYSVDYYKVVNKNIPKKELTNYLMTKKYGKKIKNFKVKINPPELKDKTITLTDSKTSEILNKIKTKGNYYLKNGDIGNGIDVLQDFVTERHLIKLKEDNIKKGDGVFVLRNEELERIKFNKKELEKIKPYYTSEQLRRYFWDSKHKYWIIYSDKEVRQNIKNYPNIKLHLDKFKKILTSAFKPYGLNRPREQRFFEGEKILSLRKTKPASFTYTNFSCYVSRAFLIIKAKDINLKYLTGLLNSKLINFWLYHKGKRQGEQLQIDKEPLLKIPIKSLTKEQEQKIIELANHMLNLQKEFHEEKTLRKDKLEQQIKNIDYEIDQEVYKLYGITKEEQKIIDGSLEK